MVIALGVVMPRWSLRQHQGRALYGCARGLMVGGVGACPCGGTGRKPGEAEQDRASQQKAL